LGVAAPAEHLYVSALFQKSSEFARKRFDRWFILSAKHGLVSPSKVLKPYNETLNEKSAAERIRWAERTFKELCAATEPGDSFTIIGGSKYRETLVPLLVRRGHTVALPTARLSIGMQLQWLDRIVFGGQPLRDVDQFYDLMGRLQRLSGGGQLMAAAKGTHNWPERGVYFFLERGEQRGTRNAEPRIVRVGTHTVSRGSRSTLWNRLRTHRGGLDKSGSHRSSVFRLHVGAALIARDQLGDKYSSWSVGQTASGETRLAEAGLEAAVSEYIGQMRVVWVPILDEPGPDSDRAYVEMNSVALLSNQLRPWDPAGPDWLGRFSPTRFIQASGLWNINHATGVYSTEFLDVLEHYVRVAEGGTHGDMKRIAPKGWHQRLRLKSRQPKQTSLFHA